MRLMSEIEARIQQLEELMEEHSLESATLKGDDWKISFDRRPPAAPVAPGAPAAAAAPARKQAAPAASSAPKGTPITSPMTGIYYSAPSPGAEDFVAEGSTVSAGETIGLIEAMKVFNEIPATASGTVVKLAAENGQLVHPGDPLLYVE
jgi:acetyl-CoA carboxylase biotin carboxyl carrier protein